MRDSETELFTAYHENKCVTPSFLVLQFTPTFSSDWSSNQMLYGSTSVESNHYEEDNTGV